MRRIVASVERVWRHVIVYPFLRVIFKNPETKLPINLSEVRSILILRYDKIGDMVVTLPVVRILKARNPNVQIAVLASEVNAEIARNEDSIDRVFVLSRNAFLMFRELYRIRSAQFQIVLNFIFNRMTSGALIANLSCANAIKVGQGQEKYRFYFNAFLTLPRGQIHMVEMLIMYIEQVFGIHVQPEEKVLSVSSAHEAEVNVSSYLKAHDLKRRSDVAQRGSNYVVFNVSARQENKRLSTQQSTAIAAFLGNQLHLHTVMIFAPEDIEMARGVVLKANCQRCLLFPPNGDANLKQIAALLNGAVSVITPDTAIVHIASAVSTPVLGIFTPLQVNQEWLPYNVRYQVIRASVGKPVSAIPTDVLIDGIDRFFRTSSDPNSNNQEK